MTNNFPRSIVVFFSLGLLALVSGGVAAEERSGPERLAMTRMVAHWANYADPAYLPFIDEAQPELVQLGFYGAHYWSLAHTPHYGGYPAHFPVQGLEECGQWFAERNRALRGRDVKVVGHFNVMFLVGDPDGPDGPRGFFKFYRDLWDTGQLGPRPGADPLELLQQNADGSPIRQQNYGIGGMGEYWACLRNPHWQQVLKAWVGQAVRQGVDGLIANYFYRHNCLCTHCQAGFRQYLGQRFSAQQLRDLGIEDLPAHRFTELVAWHDPQQTTPLRLEMLRFSQISNKQVFDDVLVRHGRSLKPDLIVAQWNHLGDFAQINSDERCLLPAELWGKDEDYLWYSTGGSANYTDLENGVLGEATLRARYLRGAFGHKPFTLGKYENTRIRAAIAELAANGGAPMGFYARFTDPEARREIARYYQFLRRYDALYRHSRPHAEAVLLFPRSQVHQGKVAAVETFRQQGRALLDAHVLFDVLPDDLASENTLQGYRHVFRTTDGELPPLDELPELSRFQAPPTVRVSAGRPALPHQLTLHLVNYDRQQPPPAADGRPGTGRGIVDENPRPVRGIRAELLVPAGRRIRRVEWISPEHPEPQAVAARQVEGQVQFTVPQLLVYGVARIFLEP